MELGNKGQIWTEMMGGIFALAAITLIYIILQQIYEQEFYTHGIEYGTDSTNLTYIDVAWKFWPIPVVIAVVWGMISVGRAQSRRYGYET